MTTISTAFSLERRIFLFAVPGFGIALLIAAIALVAAFVGRSHVERVAEAQAVFNEERTTTLNEWRESLKQIEETGEAPSPYVARPMDIRMPAILPPAPLGDFAIGSNDLHPTTTLITGWSNPADLFNAYEFANPTILSAGGFDLTFLVVVLMPLIMIAASFDVLSGDRERGRARIVAAQAGHVGASAWRRLAMRNLFVWCVFSVAAWAIALAPPAATPLADRLGDFLAWLGAALAYGLFWFAAIAFASAFLKRSETVAAALFSAWAIFVFAAPAIGGALAEAAYPPPSRLAFLSEMRKGEVRAVRETAELTAGFLADHPEMTVSDDGVPGYYQSNFLANVEAAKRTTPVLDAFNDSRASRSGLVEKLQYLSPAMIADNALKTIAGGDVERNMSYQRQARAALADLTERIGPAVVAKRRISLAEFDAIPPFDFQDRTLLQKFRAIAPPIGFLLAVAAALLFAARRRMSAALEKLL
ncbi:DUF3526 domain-containing protein [Hyphococcus sp.]|uniref:DUF3526 domain-containing protein n=1 Tax=Hyphococcus sp. TaxID=2038636 RepID=UPI003CCBDAF5